EMQMKTRVLLEPLLHLRVIMGGVVVEDQMEVPICRSLSVDELQELQPFLMAMTILALPDQGTIGHVQRRKERGSAMAHIVMGHSSGPSFLQGQSRLRAVEGLNLALLIAAEHDGVIGGVQVKA